MSYTPLVNTILTGNPRVPTQSGGDNSTKIANTAFVTSAIATAGSNYVTLDGTETITGSKRFTQPGIFDAVSFPVGPAISIVLDVDPVLDITGTGDLFWYVAGSPGVNIQYNDIANALTVDGGKLRLAQSPVGATDAANKAYVDGVASGLDIKASVRAATTGNITLSGTQTIDGVAVVAGDRVLVKNQSTGSQNGIYVVAAGSWSRATDLDEPAELNSGIFTFVEEGTINGDTGWVVTTNNPIVLGTDPVTWSQFAGGSDIVAGDGLTKTGNQLDVGQGVGITVDTDDISVDETYVMTLGTTQTVTGDKNYNGNVVFETGFTVDNSTMISSGHGDGNGIVLTGNATGDANVRFQLNADGNMSFGPGTAPTDAALWRSGVGELSITQDLVLGNQLFTQSIEVAGEALISGGAPGDLHIDGVNNLVLGAGSATFLQMPGGEIHVTDTGSIWVDATSGNVAVGAKLDSDANARVALSLFTGNFGAVSFGDGTTGLDISLYRDAGGDLHTDGSLVIDGGLSVQGPGVILGDGTDPAPFLLYTSEQALDPTVRTIVAGEADYRFEQRVSGEMFWGDGTTTPDTSLSRSAVGQLSLWGDIGLYVDGGVTLGKKLWFAGGLRVGTTTKTANYTVDLDTDHVVLCNSTGGGFTVTLPASHSAGDTVVVKDVGGVAETNAIVVDPADADTIDGLSNFTLTVNYQAATFVSNGTNWFLI